MNDPKVLLRPERLREVPPRFSWCDQRLFRHGFTAACGSDALALCSSSRSVTPVV
ncbi:MAG: hypothetical protein J0M24_22990 [Verrucomicrobia bacterium]|nr:hypothetical protein [Verrucomicrobiota bacterium]